MADEQSSDKSAEESKETTPGAPAAEVLKPRGEGGTTSEPISSDKKAEVTKALARRRSFRSSHKATFIGMIVILLLLVVNGGVVTFLIKKQEKSNGKSGLGQVNLNQSLLDQLGVDRSIIGDTGTELVVTPSARFNDKVDIAGNLNITGGATISKELKLNSKFTATDADLAQLKAGKTALSELNVNGDTTASNLVLRNNLTVTGATRLQGAVTIDKLLTVNSNLNVSGNLTIGGTLSAGGFSARSLTSTSTLTIGGHIVTAGPVPNIGGANLGGGGTVSMSGNDSAGTVAINTGSGPAAGILANIAFRTPYSTTPHVLISPVGAPTGSLGYYVNRTVGGFSIGAVNTPAAGTGYVFDYIITQ